MRKFFLTLGYSGLSKYAPGTVGSFVALLIGAFLLNYLPSSEAISAESTLFLLSILITLIAVKEINKYEAESNTHDDKSIVIDELVGMWIALSISGATLTQMVLSFIFFRYFDIKKPSIIGKVDREVKGGWGVMGDDILAGVFGGILSALVYEVIKQFI